jgi:hypothetical protein
MTPSNKERSIDRDRLLHETFKHLTTLSSAAILLIATVLVKGGFRDTWTGGRALMFFLASNFVSILVMLLISTEGRNGWAYRVLLLAGVCITFISFEGGLIAVLYFTWVNFGF